MMRWQAHDIIKAQEIEVFLMERLRDILTKPCSVDTCMLACLIHLSKKKKLIIILINDFAECSINNFLTSKVCWIPNLLSYPILPNDFAE